jgi:hypothetical protein
MSHDVVTADGRAIDHKTADNREQVARAKVQLQLRAEAVRIAQLPRAERRAATRASLAHKLVRAATRRQRRAFGGWAGAFRNHHPSVRP